MQEFIFDFNGTLFQDTELHNRAWRDFLALRGIHLTDEQFQQRICGLPNDAILRGFLGPALTGAQIAEMSAEKEAIYRDIVRSDPALQHLTPGAPELLDALKAKGVPFAIATGSILDNVAFYMRELGIDRWFDYDRIFYDEGDLPGKPDPAIYRLAMQKLGYAPAEVTVIEDSLPGVRSAVAAGVGRVIAIDTTLGPDAFCGIPEVAAVIHDFYGFERFVEA